LTELPWLHYIFCSIRETFFGFYPVMFLSCHSMTVGHTH